MSNEKQIDKQAVEEMAFDICQARRANYADGCRVCCYHEVCIYQEISSILYTAGYRRQSEGEWTPADYLYDDDGKWQTYRCSSCGCTTESYFLDVRDVLHKYKFCPQCGAKMKGGTV